MWRLALVLGVAATCSCGGNPFSPSKKVSVTIMVEADGPFSIRFRGETITATGAHTFQLEPGSYDLQATMRTYVLAVVFTNLRGLTSGGVQTGSVQSLAGPDPAVGQCDVTYITFRPPEEVRLRFRVTESRTSACQ